jgi:hypothetical protein
MLRTERARRALVFECSDLGGREGFQQMGNETLVAVVAPGHALLQAAARFGGLGEARLSQTRQTVVAGRDAGMADPRLLFLQQLWRTDSPQASVVLLEAGPGQAATQPVATRLAAGTLRVQPLQWRTNALALSGRGLLHPAAHGPCARGCGRHAARAHGLTCVVMEAGQGARPQEIPRNLREAQNVLYDRGLR